MRKMAFAALVGGMVWLAACGGRASLYGLVREAAGPVEAAEVLVLQSDGGQVVERVLTGTGGKFLVRTPLAAGTYVVEVRHPGYQALRQTVQVPQTASIEVTLLPLIEVQGIVRLPDHRGAAGASVRFRRGEDPPVEVQADEAGHFVAPGLVPGAYVVEARSADGQFRHTAQQQLDGSTREVALDLLLQAGGTPDPS